MSWNPWKLRRLLTYCHGVVESLDSDLQSVREENQRLREELARNAIDVRLEDAIRQWLKAREVER